MDCFFNPSYNSESFLNDPGFLSFRSRSFSSRTTDFRLNKSELEKQFGPFDALGDFNLQTHMKSRPKIASSNEGSSVSQNCSNLRKRKSVSKGKSQKVVEDDHDDRDSKRFKTIKNKGIENDEKRNEKQNDENKKAPEPPKDYIHVRARRGEATDSHSLAERVRREKIGEKMKILQDLVPGCNKVTGKALMLDEIINYVQSLQCQVEYLSVKLASVDPLKINTDSVLPKDVTNSIHPLDSSFQAKTDFSTHCSLDHSDTTRSTLFRDISFQLPLVDNFGQGFPQFSGSYEDDLQSIVQMGFKQNPSNNLEFHSQSFPGNAKITTLNLRSPFAVNTSFSIF